MRAHDTQDAIRKWPQKRNGSTEGQFTQFCAATVITYKNRTYYFYNKLCFQMAIMPSTLENERSLLENLGGFWDPKGL